MCDFLTRTLLNKQQNQGNVNYVDYTDISL